MQVYGERLKEYRIKNNLTQTQAAIILSMPQSNYSRLEKGEQDIKLSMILLICNRFKISADWLLGLKENENETI